MRLPTATVKCKYCGAIFPVTRAEYMWLSGSYVRGGCPSCGHYLDAAKDVLNPRSPSDPEKRANVCTPDPSVAWGGGGTMSHLHVIHTDTGRAPDPQTQDLLVGDQAAYLGECGIDTRKVYAVQHAYPVQFRRVLPEHGRYPATMHRPTLRKRVVAWWQTHRAAILRDAVLTVSFIVAIIGGAVVLHAFVTSLAAAIEWALP